MAQVHDHSYNPSVDASTIEPQPLLSQALRISDALSLIGNSLPEKDLHNLNQLRKRAMDENTVREIQHILDKYCLLEVTISPEARVSVNTLMDLPKLQENGWQCFLIKVNNGANVTSKLRIESPNDKPLYKLSKVAPHKLKDYELNVDDVTEGDIDNRFLRLAIYDREPMSRKLSGFDLEYVILQIYTKTRGLMEVQIGVDIGEGTEDIGYKGLSNILFDIQPSVKVIFDVLNGGKSDPEIVGSFIITDDIERYKATGMNITLPWRYYWKDWEVNEDMSGRMDSSFNADKLSGIYPLPSMRLAYRDTYPDFHFQPQIYRKTGEYLYLTPGTYSVIYTRGPEYKEKHKTIVIPEGRDSVEISFNLERWIDLNKEGWYSADHHIHAAGCSHYESPQEGVDPEAIFRAIQGEDLDLGSVLNWQPGWDYQQRFFTGGINLLSDENNLLRYDIEVSGFPSSHAGHLALLNLKTDKYHGLQDIYKWPSWTIPILKWAKDQGGVTAYAHSGWGLEPVNGTFKVPNFETPKMDGIGANEYIVAITQDLVDYYSLGDTPAPWELNMLYHSLNSGFKINIGGETDYPCISDERVGLARTYARLKGEENLTFESYMEALKSGRTYVSDGLSHLIDFKINNVEIDDEEDRTLNYKSTKTLDISIKAAAYLDKKLDQKALFIRGRSPDEFPYWNIERARINNSRAVYVELIVNGRVANKQRIEADGDFHKVSFKEDIEESSWIALRINYSSHTNPAWIAINNRPVMMKKSIQWCLEAVEQCWKEKKNNFKQSERREVKKDYDEAITFYNELIHKL